ncbi:uncharacterized protein FOMMEDRAFT_164961 [Fomitiporia mediterranea MF3/22]|uniref:uncharacterized protein n=1 Tax=Fomitiporia mediterranea (strain MF3/22) TaxID=694068 RepID=UPI0004409814|nr:uncharacterized protein FOMMEDRAFT_164961 [Fomitiporia mediterranea MF3/22]EJD08308.1 hypothetical protein FOMMEDRAFT_164961 [Fomitiporia mediterranea MF3/22]
MDAHARDDTSNLVQHSIGTANIAHTMTTPGYYCAYMSKRSAAAKTRNYGNCLQCKEARQKCNRVNGSACERCLRLRKKCSLIGTASPSSPTTPMSPVDPHPEATFGTRYTDAMLLFLSIFPLTIASITVMCRSLSQEDEERFGRVLYIIPLSDGTGFDVIHAMVGGNGHEQAYQTGCDKALMPRALPDYLGPLTNNECRLESDLEHVIVNVCAVMIAVDLLSLPADVSNSRSSLSLHKVCLSAGVEPEL